MTIALLCEPFVLVRIRFQTVHERGVPQRAFLTLRCVRIRIGAQCGVVCIELRPIAPLFLLLDKALHDRTHRRPGLFREGLQPSVHRIWNANEMRRSHHPSCY